MQKKDRVAKIITVFNQKGGCAKTMTTMQLGGALGLMGLDVFIVDMDPQNTSALWDLQASADAPFPAKVMSMAPLRENFLEKLTGYVAKFDVILVDCPPALESRVPWASLLASDFALIPVIPVMDNVWASKQAEELVIKARESRAQKGIAGELQAGYVLSQYRRGKVFEMCHGILKEKAVLPILGSQVSMRNAFPESQVYGCVAKSFGKSPAATEIDNLAMEIAKLIDLKIPKAIGK